MQNGQQPAAYAGVPEIVRVRATRGFRGNIDGSMGIALPGDVVDVPRDLAVTLRFGDKAVMVDPKTDKNRQDPTKFVPERKKNKPLDANGQQLKALTDAVATMTETLATQGKAIEALLGNAKKA